VCDKLVPSKINKKTNKSLRRNIRRLADRKGISYESAILHFYGVKSISEIDKNLFYSLNKNCFKGNCHRFL
jgi:hypothetical protein